MIHPKTRAQWHAWLAEHHASSKGVWVITYKKATGKPRVEYEDLVEEALAFGWIDGKARTLDESRSMQWLAPRSPTSGWSKSNKQRVEKLEREGAMMPAGRRAVELARRNGSWTLLDGVEALEVPDDLRELLNRDAQAARNFASFPPSSRKGFLFWIASAKRPETRAKRLAETVRCAAISKRDFWRP